MRACEGDTLPWKYCLGNFLERQEAVAVFAVVDETGFQRRLDAGDDGLVDVALALFASFNLDFVVEQFLPVDDRQAAFFGLRGVDQHALHDAFPFSLSLTKARGRGRTPVCREPARKTRTGEGIAGEPLTWNSPESGLGALG